MFFGGYNEITQNSLFSQSTFKWLLLILYIRWSDKYQNYIQGMELEKRVHIISSWLDFYNRNAVLEWSFEKRVHIGNSWLDFYSSQVVLEREPSGIPDFSNHEWSWPQLCCKKGVLHYLSKFAGKRLCQSLVFRRLLQRSFPVNFAKFFRISSFIEQLLWLLLKSIL